MPDRGRSSFDGVQRDSTPSSIGQKRLFSDRDSKQLSGYQDVVEGEDAEDEVHSGKRHRTTDWPLPAPTPSARPSQQRRRNATKSPPGSSQRPSRFVEGSMNDRVSRKPPPPYIGDDDMRERYEDDEQTHGRKFAKPRRGHINEEGSVAGRSDASRNSIFRFGKSIAASSFNPTNWKIFKNLQAPPEEDERAVEHQILVERAERAARIYQELKASGQFRDTTIGSDFYEPIEATPKHDSGVDMIEKAHGGSIRGRLRSLSRGRGRRADSTQRTGSTTREEKRQGRLFLQPPALAPSIRCESPALAIPTSVSRSQPGTPNKSKFEFKKPSLSNIGKSFRNDSINSLLDPDGHQPMRRIPSRKDLQKQQKLVKRVSDLESKLGAARRQLNESIVDPTVLEEPERGRSRGPRKFVPGFLPTLPSERLLSGYLESEAEDGGIVIGQAVTVDQPVITHPPRRPLMKSNSFGVDRLPPGRSRAPSVDRLPSVEFGESAVGTKISRLPETVTAETPAHSFSNPVEEDGEMANPKPQPAAKKRKSVGDDKTISGMAETNEESEKNTTPKETQLKRRATTGGVRCDSCNSGKKGCYIEAGENTCSRCVELDKACLVKGQPMPTQSVKNYYYSISDDKSLAVKPSNEPITSKPIEPSRPAPAAPKTMPPTDGTFKVTPTKKRNRTKFVGYADDGGEYEPEGEPSCESEESVVADGSDSGVGITKSIKSTSQVKARTPAKKLATQQSGAQRPRKLQKTSPTNTAPPKPSSQALARNNSKATGPKASEMTSNRLSKSKIPNLQHPKSPSADFSGLDYRKPSKPTTPGPMVREDTAEQGERDGEDGYAIPPVPKLPKTIRMPSGEVVEVKNSGVGAGGKGNGSTVSKGSRASQGYRGKLSKARPVVKDKENADGEKREDGGDVRGKESFEWPEDVF